MAKSSDPTSQPSPTAPDAAYREVRYEHSDSLVPLLERIGASLLVSTYQAGKLVVVGHRRGSLSLSFHNFERPMGLAVSRHRIAVGTGKQICFLHAAPQIASRIEPAGQHDGCYLARSIHITGDVHCHEMAWAGDELWIVNTLFSCLCTLAKDYSFVPRWQPPFVSALAAEDRCHLNGLAMVEGEPKYVTTLAQTDTPEAWRPNKVTSGCVIEVPSGQTVGRGFAMPHSPRVYNGRLWLLDSGTGRLVMLVAATGSCETVAELPGYTRGLAFHGPYGFVGLSKIRETSTFGGVPIAEHREQLKCAVVAVDLVTRRSVAYLEFKSGVDEIFDVQVLPGVRCPAVVGPYAVEDGRPTIWLVPSPSPSEVLPSSPAAVSVKQSDAPRGN